jgi:hypothetical protein
MTMKRFEGTPGPWETCGYYIYGKDEKGNDVVVADCRLDPGYGPYRVKDEKTAVRNQKAMTAVPELIDACRYVVEWHREHDNGEGELFGLDFVTTCISALNKALGD